MDGERERERAHAAFEVLMGPIPPSSPKLRWLHIVFVMV